MGWGDWEGVGGLAGVRGWMYDMGWGEGMVGGYGVGWGWAMHAEAKAIL